MKNKKGVLLTLIGGTFWGLSGACGQYLFQYKNATSDWLVPLRLAIAGFLLLCYLYLRRGNQIFDIWKTKKMPFRSPSTESWA